MASHTLYPAIVDSYMPAFQVFPGENNICTVLFSLSRFTSSSDIKEVHISVTKQGSGLNTVNSLTNSENRFRNTGIILVDGALNSVGNNLYSINIYDEDLNSVSGSYQGWIPGDLYKVQLRLSFVAYNEREDADMTQSEWLNTQAGQFSEWSTVCTVKPIGDIKVTTPTFSYSGTNPSTVDVSDYSSTTLEFVGDIESIQDASEVLYSYRVKLYEGSSLLEDSGDIITKNYQNVNKFNYLFKIELTDLTNYSLVFSYETNNGFLSIVTFNFSVAISYDSGINAYVATIENDANKVMWGITTVSKEEDEGRIGLKVFSDTRIDILTNTDKDLNNWTTIGENPSITFSNEENVIVYDNIIRTPAQTLKYLLETASGIPVTDTCINQLLNQWEQYPNFVFYYLELSGLDIHCWLGNANDYIDASGFHVNAGDVNLTMRTPGGTIMESIYSTTIVPDSRVYPSSSIVNCAYIGTYADIIAGLSYNCNINKNFVIEDGETYLLQFKGCSPSGFIASEDQVTVTSGSNIRTTTIDNNQTSIYSDYEIEFVADGNSVNIDFDLTKIASYDTVTLDIKNIALYKKSNNYTGTLIIRRSDSKSNFTSWVDIKTIECNQTDINGLGLFYDYTVESGVWYLYALQTLRNGNRSILLFPMNQGVEMRNPSLRNFEYSFLLGENNQQLKLKFDNTMGSYKIQQMESKFETIGNRFPYTSRNAALNYKLFPINGLISYMMDDNKLFCDKKVIYTYDDIVGLYKDYESNNRITYNSNYIYERDFRNKVIEFLINGKPKVFKSPTEGNVIVRLMEVNFVPNQSLDRMIYSFTSNGNEIAESNIDNYVKYNFLDLYSIKSEEANADAGHVHNTADVKDSPVRNYNY